ncbi:plasma membrane calcium [Coemansia sp. RSA 1694]|nr:plasma membrane calcium [Coemansia sp. RSA 1694]
MAPVTGGGSERTPLLPGGGGSGHSSGALRSGNPFGVEPEQLTDMLDPKDVDKLLDLGGPDQICKALLVDPKVGLKQREQVGPGSEPFQARREVFGRNTLPEAHAVTFLQLLAAAYNDRTLSK